MAGHEKSDAILILSLILIVMVTMFGQNATRIALGPPKRPGRGWSRRCSRRCSAGADPAATAIWYTVFFWGHMLAVLGFLNYLPYSKHLHVLTSVPNVYFSPLGPKGALAPINLADETLTKYGATDVDDLTWKQLLNGITCTECGRCTAVCPANITGKLLNPKKIMTDIRAAAEGEGENCRDATIRCSATSCSTISSPNRSSGPAPPAWPACRNAR